MQSVTSNAVAGAVDTIIESLIGTLKTETQGWSNNHSYTLKREGKYLLFCSNPNNQCTGVYFVLGRHRTNTSLVGYAETIKSPSGVTYNVSVSGDTLRITGDYCVTNLIFISDV